MCVFVSMCACMCVHVCVWQEDWTCHTCVVDVEQSRDFLSSSNTLSSDCSLFLVPCSLSRTTSLGWFVQR
jgi:hypothetical protein